VGQGLAPLARRYQGNGQTLRHGPLADDLVQPLGTKPFIDRIDHTR
jgi:hypothetical protein